VEPRRPVTELLDKLKVWAIGQPSIRAVALVGSYARGTATANSDVDLVILADTPERLLIDRTWLRTFGEPISETLEDYGLLKSIRARYRNGLEVEFGVADVEWPADPGSRQVIKDGIQVLFERGRVLSDYL
jgi:predicted nucleotidyltransferase